MTEANGRRFSSSKLIAVVAFVLGMILGPGYMLMCGHATGTSHTFYTIYTAEDASIAPAAPDGTEAGPPAPVEQTIDVILHPDMLPVGFNIIAETVYKRPSQLDRDQYVATLSRAGEIIWQREFTLGEGLKRETLDYVHSAQRIMTMRQVDADTYQFTVTRPASLPGMQRIRLDVRQGVALANKWVIIAGLLLLAAVIVYVIVPGKDYDAKAARDERKSSIRWWNE